MLLLPSTGWYQLPVFRISRAAPSVECPEDHEANNIPAFEMYNAKNPTPSHHTRSSHFPPAGVYGVSEACMAFMFQLIKLIFTVVLYSSITLSSPLNLPPQPVALFPSTSDGNLSKALLSPPWDSRFSIRAGYSHARLQPTAVLMNAVNVAARLAVLDFNQRFIVDIAPLQRYPDVKIDFVPVPPMIAVETKILVWGLYGGINDIVGRKQFREVEFDLLWNGKVVAWLRFEKAVIDMVEEPAGGKQPTIKPQVLQTSIQNDTMPPRLQTDTGLTTNPTPFAFSAQYTPYSKPLSIFQVFMSVFSALVQIAPLAATSDVKELAYEAQDFNSRIVVFKKDRKVRQIFEYRWLVEGLKRIPEFMFESARFAELEWEIVVNGKEVGSGYCEWTDWRRQGGTVK